MEPWYVVVVFVLKEVKRNSLMISDNCFMKENKLLDHNSGIACQKCYFLLSCYLLLLIEYLKVNNFQVSFNFTFKSEFQ